MKLKSHSIHSVIIRIARERMTNCETAEGRENWRKIYENIREQERENIRLRDWIIQQHDARLDDDGRWIDGNGEYLDIL